MSDEFKVPIVDGIIPTLEKAKKDYVKFVLARYNNRKHKAAKALGIDRKTLYRILGDVDGQKRRTAKKD